MCTRSSDGTKHNLNKQDMDVSDIVMKTAGLRFDALERL